ncbi:MAG: hypothetical protein FJ109_20170, partial [Deltaproteobacteria bacterium]|nr:hypothetical protein [Deltaproteobacteria bacterium]
MAKQDRGVLERELNMRWMSMLQTMLQEQIEEDQNLALVRLTRLPKSATAGVRANAARRRKLAGKEPFVEPGRTDVPVVEGATSGFSMRPQTEQAGNEDRALIEDADDIRARMPSTEDEMTPLVSERSMFSTFWQLEGMESFVALDRWVGFKRDKRQDPGPVMAIHSLIRTVVRYWAQSSGYGAKPITLDPFFQFAGKNKELKEGGMLPVEVLIRKLNEAGISTATSAHSPEVADYMTAALYATVGHYLSVMVGGNIDEVMLGMLDATNTPSDRKRAVLVQMLADTASEQQQKVVKRMTDVEVGVAVVLKEIAEANPFLADLFPTILQDLRTAFYDSVREQGNAILEEVILFDFGSIARMKILEAFGWSVVAKDVVDEGIFDAEAIMEQTHMGKVMRPDIQIRAAQLAMGRLQAARMDEMDGVTVHKSSSRYERTGISPLKQEKNKQLDEMGDTTREALDDEDLDDKPNEFGLTPAQVAELDKVGAVQPGLWTRGLSFLSDHGINLAVLEDHLVSLKREIHATRTTASRRAIAKDDMLRVKQMLEDYIDQGKAHGIESGNENDMRELMKQLGWEDVLDSGQDDRHMAQLEVFAEMPDEEMLFDPDTFSPSYEVMDFRAAQPSSRATVINTTVVGVTDNAVAQMMREIRPGTVLIPAGYQLMGNMRSPIIEAMKEADGVLFVQADAHQDRTTGGGMLDWMNEVLHYGPQTMNPGDRIRMRKIGWSDKYHIGQVVPDERSLMNNTSVAVPLVASPNPLSGPARAVFTIDLSQPWSFDPRALATTFNRWLQKNGVRNLVIASTLAPTHATANKK